MASLLFYLYFVVIVFTVQIKRVPLRANEISRVDNLSGCETAMMRGCKAGLVGGVDNLFAD